MAATVDPLLDDARFTPLHRRVWLLSSMGIMLDGFDFFIMGVAIPLIRQDWDPSSWEVGLIGSAAVIGAIVGALTLGTMADRLGRQLAFRIDLGLFVVFALASALAPDVWWLIAFRFMLGIGIGADYPISSAYVAEIAPARNRTRLLVGAFSFQAVGQLLGVLVGLVLLTVIDDAGAWRPMLAFGVVPAVAIVWLRRSVPESPKWLASFRRPEEAAEVYSMFCERPVSAAEVVRAVEHPSRPPHTVRWRDLFSPRLRRTTAFVSAPWFLMDIATYGVGVFTPTIIAAIVVSTPTGTADNQYIADDITSTVGAAFVDGFLIVGFLLAIALIYRVGRLRLQLVGFVVMALALLLLAWVSALPGGSDQHLPLVFLGFGAFNLFMNMGPNATTFAMPAEVYATSTRAAGSGFAAAAGKTGAALGTFVFPIAQDDLGLSWTLVIIATGCALAAGITFGLRSVLSPRPGSA